ncbi:OPT oligopeptide transporter protein-domain-containing protein [Kockovaella imperatae]|uniref:OPT oligopeptide transporter protein-domain-containing protein n=1 Tax=Kockovaella imperatae TaxID=4999 RepID=A0A1Y1U8K4_9TREE|nr:OPT oligopeptide transporter protein-domain-containing protein [Kockovaella imperatae]ORX33445.1 OPT oligopeptide transporter protein-domain-containing protein [Kockovaella imperatae]
MGANDIAPAYGQVEDKKINDTDVETEKVAVTAAPDLDSLSIGEEVELKKELELFDNEITDLEEKLVDLSVAQAYSVAKELFDMHKHDQLFPLDILEKLEEFSKNYEEIAANPGPHATLIRDVKIEVLLATENSPYLEVRANTETTDDPTMPVMTFRSFLIGTIFAVVGSFIDTLFSFRQPAIGIGTSVAQLLAYPFGNFLARVLPRGQFRIFGHTCSLNPGPFNKKEHMLITIMCNVSMTSPYTVYIVPVQYLPGYFDESFAHSRGYQYLNTLGTNMVGYGMAGLLRRFLVWPSFAVWPGTFNNMALIKAFHTEKNEPVRGPFGKMYTWSREKFFLITFIAMFVYYWFPGFIWTSLSYFSWITWIAPNNLNLDAVTGFNGGMGFNPWPSWDWNIAGAWFTPLTVPLFSVVNIAISAVIINIATLAIWYTNKWNTGYLPINQPGTYDNTGNSYNVSRILKNGRLDLDLYQSYSEPWMTAGFITAYIGYFVMYGATLVYIPLFHRHQVARAFKGFAKAVKASFRRGSDGEQDLLDEDIHAKLMKEYKDVPEWAYMILLVVFAAIGMIGVAIYPDDTSPVVMVFGIILCLLTMIPVGLITATTGVSVPTNVISEFIGGSLVSGNANALMYFKTYGYISAAQAVSFSNDLKLAHYFKLPPWHTFTAQVWATLLYCIVSASIFNYAMGFRDICTEGAAFHLTCPGQTTYFTASVFWGTLSPKRLFGPGKRYTTALLGFPVGAAMVFVYWGLKRAFPRSSLIRGLHPVMLAQGGVYFLAPYNISYMLPLLYVTVFSFKIVRPRYTQFWAKYNYVLAASFPTGIAIAGVIIFFALEVPHGGYSLNWWGNNVLNEGYEGSFGAPRLAVPTDPGYFGPPQGSFT